MNLVDAVESQIRATLDKYAFQINACFQDQAAPDRYEDFTNALKKYGEAATQLEILQKVKLQIDVSDNTKEEKDEA
tara:strand:+ start:947 stop:1174 length:228 start_codon:yes stop_codon:yes gene_type:complete